MYDVVIIGGGHNGLVCSAYLAMAGLNVVVLDQRELNLARFVRLADGPVSAANVSCAVLDDGDKQAEREYPLEW